MAKARRRRRSIPKDLIARQHKLVEELKQIADDPELRERAEELHGQISRMSVEDMFRRLDAARQQGGEEE